MSTNVIPGCPNANNAYHECNDRCLDEILSANVPKKEKKRFGFIPGFGKSSSPSHVNAGNKSPLPSFYTKRKVESDESPSFSSSNDSIRPNYFSPRSPLHERSSQFQPKNVDVNDANSEKDVLPMSPSLAEYSNRDYFASKFGNRGGEALVSYEEDAEMSPGPRTPEHRSSTSDNRLWPTKPESSDLETGRRSRTPEHRSKLSNNRPMTPEHESFAALRPRPKTPHTGLRTAQHRARSPEYGQRSSGHQNIEQGHQNKDQGHLRTAEHRARSPEYGQRSSGHQNIEQRHQNKEQRHLRTAEHRARSPEYGHRSSGHQNIEQGHQNMEQRHLRTRARSPEYGQRSSGPRSKTPEPQGNHHHSKPRTPKSSSPVIPQVHPISHRSLDIDRPTSPLNVETQPISHRSLEPTALRSPRRVDTRPQTPKHQPISSETRVRTQDSTPKPEEHRARPSDQRPRLTRIRSRTPEPHARYHEPRARMPEARSRTPEPGPRTRQDQRTSVNIDDNFFSAARRSSQASKYVELTPDSVYSESTLKAEEHRARPSDQRPRLTRIRSRTPEPHARYHEPRARMPETRSRTPEPGPRTRQDQQTSVNIDDTFFSAARRSSQASKYVELTPDSVYSEDEEDSFLRLPESRLSPQENRSSRFTTPKRIDKPTRHEETDQMDEPESIYDDNSLSLDDPDDNSSYLYPEVATPIHRYYRKSTDKQSNEPPPELPNECKIVVHSETERMEELQICTTEEETQSTISESYVSVENYKVRSSVSATLQQILDKHGDIASGSKTQSLPMKSFYLETLAAVVFELQSTPLKQLKESRVEEMVAAVKDIESMKIKASWLSEVLKEILEATKHYDRHKTTVMEKEKCERDVLHGKQKMEKIVKEVTLKEKEVKEGRERAMEIAGRLGNLEMKKTRLEKRLAFLSSKVNKFEGDSVLPIV